MKNLIKYLCGLFLLMTTYQANASKIVNIKELADRMCKNENVDQFIKNRTNAVLSMYFYNICPDKDLKNKSLFEIKVNDFATASEKNLKDIEVEFPEYSALNFENRTEILKLIIKNEKFVAAISAKLKCFGVASTALFVCCTGSSRAFKTWVFASCITAAMFADITFYASNPELFPGIYTTLKVEYEVCMDLAMEADVDITSNCWTAYTGAAVACLFL